MAAISQNYERLALRHKQNKNSPFKGHFYFGLRVDSSEFRSLDRSKRFGSTNLLKAGTVDE